MDISNTVALVTGGASGLGRATVEALVAKGGKAVVLDLPGAGDDVAAALGDSVKVVGADVRDGVQPREGERGRWMPAFAGVFTDEQMAALVEYVRTLADGAPPWRGVDDVVKRVEREERAALEERR